MSAVPITVERGSRAWKAGLRSGMVLESINGEPLLDFIDYEYFSALSELTVRTRDGGEYRIVKREYEPLGLDPQMELYPPERRCANRCIFCFEDQLPCGMRESLHSKDDDWRYSLLFGNYVTLTNVSEGEFDRLIRRRVSPLYVSVHATDGEVRRRMLRNPRADRIMEQLTRLKQGGIGFHGQVVLCPGINDGAVLERTVHDLWSLYPAARSVAVVPLGMTAHRQGLEPLTALDREGARRAIAQVEAFARWAQREVGTPFVYASDEMYQLAGLEWPRYGQEGYRDQIANGVGLFHELLADFAAALEDAPRALEAPRCITLATGASAHGSFCRMMEQLSEHTEGFSARTVCIRNEFFGESVTVAGLITGGDLLRQLRPLELGDGVLIPGSCLRDGEDVFLDDMTLETLEQELGVPVIPVPDDGYRLVELALGLKEEAWE